MSADQKPISANQGLNLTRGFYFYCLKAFSPIVFFILYRESNHQIEDKIVSLNLLFKLSYLKSNFALALGYLHTASNNPALRYIRGILLVDLLDVDLQGISVKVKVTAYSHPLYFAVMTLYKIYSRLT